MTCDSLKGACLPHRLSAGLFTASFTPYSRCKMPGDVQSRMAVFLFTDIVDSTAIQNRLGTDAYLRLLARHDAIYQEAVVATYGGRIVERTGDGFLTELASPSDAVNAALHFQALMRQTEWPGETIRTRCAIHLGELTQHIDPQTGEDRHASMAINFAARLMDLGQGGQILLSRAVFDDARRNVRAHPPAGSDIAGKPLRWEAHGRYLFKGAVEPTEVFEVGVQGQSPLQAPPDSNKAKRYLDAEEAQTLGWRPAIGLEIPRREGWVLDKKIGEGGFGEVWLARHHRLKEQRVFKFCFDAARLNSFRRELTLFRLLRDALGDRRDIARLHDVQMEKAPFFLESEYCPDGNLADWAERQGGIGNVPLATRLDLLARTARAVAAAHSVGIIHKDIKPANILIFIEDGQPQPRLADFGIGVLADRRHAHQHAITVAGFTGTRTDVSDASRTGTRLYAAPEYLAGGAATTQGDVYALGVVLYQFLARNLGKPLGPGWERDVPDELLREDVAAAVDGDPARRLTSAAELACRLETLTERRQERERLAAAATQAAADRARLARRRVQLRLAGVVIAVLAVAASVLTWGYRLERRERENAEAAEALARSLVFDMRSNLDRLGDQQLVRDLNQRVADYYRRLDPDKLGKEPLRRYAAALNQLGDSLIAMGDLSKATEAYVRGLAILVERRKRDPEGVFRSDLIVSFGKVAGAAKAAGDIVGARSNLLQALEMARALASDHPDRLDALRFPSAVLDRLGDLEEMQQDFAAAIRYQREALEISRAIAAKAPDGRQQQQDLAGDEAKLAKLLSASGEHAAAIQLGQSSVAARRRLASQRTDDASAIEELLKGLDTLTGLQIAAEQFAPAEPTAREALEVAGRLAARDPKNMEWQRDLAICHSSMGEIARQTGRLSMARQHAEKACKVAEAIAVRDAGRPQWQRDVAIALGRVAKIQASQGEPDGAIKNRERSLSILQRLVREQPGALEFQTAIANAAHDLSEFHGQRGGAGDAEALRCLKVEQDALSKLQAAKRLLPAQATRLEELAAKTRKLQPVPERQ